MQPHLSEKMFLDFISGNLTDKMNERVLNHLIDCKRCRDELALFTKMSCPTTSSNENRMLMIIFPESNEDSAKHILQILNNYYNKQKRFKPKKFFESLKVHTHVFISNIGSLLKRKSIAIPSIVAVFALLFLLINPIGRYTDHKALTLINTGNKLLVKNVKPKYTLPLRPYGSFPWTEFRILRGGISDDTIKQDTNLEDYFKKALKLSGKNPAVLSSAGNYYLLTGNFKSAKLLFKQALDIQPDNYIAANGMGIISYKKGKFDVAIKYFSLAKKSNPTFVESIYNLAFLYKTMGKSKEAKRELLDYLKMDSTSKWADNARKMLNNL